MKFPYTLTSYTATEKDNFQTHRLQHFLFYLLGFTSSLLLTCKTMKLCPLNDFTFLLYSLTLANYLIHFWFVAYFLLNREREREFRSIGKHYKVGAHRIEQSYFVLHTREVNTCKWKFISNIFRCCAFSVPVATAISRCWNIENELELHVAVVEYKWQLAASFLQNL